MNAPAQNQNAEIQALGYELVRSFHVTMRTIRSHGWSNEASLQGIESFVDASNKILSVLGEFGLHVNSEFLFVNDVRLKVDALGRTMFDGLAFELQSRGLGSVLFDGELNRRGVEAFLESILLTTEDEVAQDPQNVVDRINRTMNQKTILVEVMIVKDENDLPSDVDMDRKERAKKAFFKAVTVARAVLTSAHLNKRLNLRRAKRVVQNMVDLMMEEEFTLMGMTTLKDYDNYTFYHSVNVCIFSLALGKRLGLSKVQLSELGVAAMMHDMGKTKVPIEILRKRGMLDSAEIQVMKRHPEAGVRELVKMRGLSSLAFKSMMAAFEHHLNYNPDLPGYPAVRNKFKPHVVGRIVAIADCFDAMTTKRCYTPKAVTRDKALAFMLAQGGKKFDPVLVKIFANLVGVFPVGTLVKLKSGRLAVVTEASEDSTLCHRPHVKPITNRQGIEVEQAEIDLSIPGPNGSVPDEILCAVDDESVGIDVAKYFM